VLSEKNTSISYVINTSILSTEISDTVSMGEEMAQSSDRVAEGAVGEGVHEGSTTPATSLATSSATEVSARTREHENNVPSNETRKALAEVDNVTIPIYTEGTVLSAMEAHRDASDFTFSGSSFPGLGFFVDTIDGRRTEDGYHWLLYIDGEMSSRGVSSARVAPGSVVEWRYEKNPY